VAKKKGTAVPWNNHVSDRDKVCTSGKAPEGVSITQPEEKKIVIP